MVLVQTVKSIKSLFISSLHHYFTFSNEDLQFLFSKSCNILLKLFLVKRIKQVGVSVWINHFRPFRCWVPKHAFNLSFWPGLSSLFICITLGPCPSIIILKEESLILDTVSVSSQKSFKSLRGESLL